GTVTFWLRVIGVPPFGGVIVAVTVAAWAAAVLLVTSVLTVSAALDKSAASAWLTCELPTDNAPSTCSWTGNWMPVLLSGGIWVQSTLSRVNKVVGSFGLTSMATELTPDRSRPVTGKLKRVYAPVTVADVATWVPFTQTLADPTTPLTIRLATWPACKLGVKSARHHQGTANSLTETGPILLPADP